MAAKLLLPRLECMNLSNTTIDMYKVYYIKNNYMFRHFTLAIFRLRNEPEYGQCKVPKYIVVLYVMKSIHISTIIQLCQTNTYTPIQFNYKHNGDDEPYDSITKFRNWAQCNTEGHTIFHHWTRSGTHSFPQISIIGHDILLKCTPNFITALDLLKSFTPYSIIGNDLVQLHAKSHQCTLSTNILTTKSPQHNASYQFHPEPNRPIHLV